MSRYFWHFMWIFLKDYFNRSDRGVSYPIINPNTLKMALFLQVLTEKIFVQSRISTQQKLLCTENEMIFLGFIGAEEE